MYWCKMNVRYIFVSTSIPQKFDSISDTSTADGTKYILLETVCSGISICYLWCKPKEKKERKLIFVCLSTLFFLPQENTSQNNSSSSGNGSKNGSGGGGSESIKSRQGTGANPGSKSNSASNNKSRPKYLECWGDADKPFANITENNATAKSTAMMVYPTLVSDSLVQFEYIPIFFSDLIHD